MYDFNKILANRGSNLRYEFGRSKGRILPLLTAIVPLSLYRLDASEHFNQITKESHVQSRFLTATATVVESIYRIRECNIFQSLHDFLYITLKIYQLGNRADVELSGVNLYCHSLTLHIYFGEWQGELVFIVLALDVETMILKFRLQIFHAEKFTAHIPLAVPENEVFRIMAFQAIKGVCGSVKNLTVIEATNPLFATKVEIAFFANDVFTTHDSHKCVNHKYCKERIKLHGKSYGYSIISTPCTLFFRITGLNCYNEVGAFRTEYLRYALARIKYICFAVYQFQCRKKCLSLFGPGPIVNFLTKSLGHVCKTNPAIVVLAFYRHIQTVNFDDFNQILIVEHIYKNCDIKNMRPLGVLNTYNGGRESFPIVSARPP